MVSIYKITDCNGLCYVGSTKSNVKKRLYNHCYHKRIGRIYYSSHKLDLDNCDIQVLETCNPEVRFEREQHYIDTIDCVNVKNCSGGRDPVKRSLWRKKFNNKESSKKKNLDRYYWRVMWGENQRDTNNLLKIDVNLFQ